MFPTSGAISQLLGEQIVAVGKAFVSFKCQSNCQRRPSTGKNGAGNGKYAVTI